MPKKGNKRLAKRGGQGDQSARELILPTEDQVFGTIIKALGDSHFTVECQDKLERRCKVRGKMRNRQFVQVGQVVIVSTRDYSEGTGDIIHAYTNSEVKDLRKTENLLMKEIPTSGEDKKENEDVFEWDAL